MTERHDYHIDGTPPETPDNEAPAPDKSLLLDEFDDWSCWLTNSCPRLAPAPIFPDMLPAPICRLIQRPDPSNSRRLQQSFAATECGIHR